jgi:hypothetical protein
MRESRRRDRLELPDTFGRRLQLAVLPHELPMRLGEVGVQRQHLLHEPCLLADRRLGDEQHLALQAPQPQRVVGGHPVVDALQREHGRLPVVGEVGQAPRERVALGRGDERLEPLARDRAPGETVERGIGSVHGAVVAQPGSQQRVRAPGVLAGHGPPRLITRTASRASCA